MREPPTRRIRVAHCIETMHTGGVEQTRLTLARGLDPERYEQVVICTQVMGALPDMFRNHGVRVHAVGRFRSAIDWGRIHAARQLLKAFEPDIVHGAVFEGVVMGTLAGKLAGVPIIIGEETADPEGRRWTGHLFFRALVGLTHRMVAVSPFVRDYLLNDLSVPPAKVRLINNGVADVAPRTAEHVQKLRARLGIGAEDFVIGTVGRLFDQQKKVSEMIRAMPAILARRPLTRLLVVGEGQDRGMLERLATECGVAPSVTFAGYQPATRPFFELMNIFVHPAASEAFGLVVAEAMMAGRPVVATAVGGIPDVVDEGKTALLIPPGDREALVEAVLKLADDAELAACMGSAGRRRAVAEFGEVRYVSEVDELYRECLATRHIS